MQQHSGPGGVPSFPTPPNPNVPSHPPLPPGWEQAIDPTSGRAYYANRSTGGTSWTLPQYFPPPPPANLMQAPLQVHQQIHQFVQPAQQPQHPIVYGAQPAVIQPQQVAQPTFQNTSVNNLAMQSNYPPAQYPPNGHPVETLQPMQQTLSQQSHSLQHTLGQEPQQIISQGPKYALGASTATNPGLLVPSIRAMIDTEYTNKTNGGPISKLELEGLSAGAIADLCNVSKEMKAKIVDGGDFAEGSGTVRKQHEEEEDVDQYYAPLQPFALPVVCHPPRIEAGRVDIRLHALHSKLGKI